MSSGTKRSGVWGWWLIYVLFIAYGSLIPFQLDGEIPPTAVEALSGLLAAYSPGAHISGMDVLANFAIYLPLGFLSVLLVVKNKGGIFLAFITSVTFGILLSFSIEICQIYFSGRTSSVIDIITNALGTATGAFMAGVFFLLFPQAGQGARSPATLLRERPVLFITLLYGTLIFLGGLVPFDISLQPSSLWTALKQMEWLPLTSSPANYANLTSELLFYGFFSGLCYFSLKLYKKPGFYPGSSSVVLTTALGLTVELCQLFIASRSTKISDVLIAALGGVVGAILSSILTKPLFMSDLEAHPENIQDTPYRLSSTQIIWVSCYSMIIIYLLSAPLKFEWRWHAAISGFTWRSLIPFYSYWTKMNFWALYDLIFTCLVFVPLGILGTYCSRPSLHARMVTLMLALFLSIGVEFLQFFNPGRYPDITDILSAVGGTLLGIWAVEKLPVPHKNSSGTCSH